MLADIPPETWLIIATLVLVGGVLAVLTLRRPTAGDGFAPGQADALRETDAARFEALEAAFAAAADCDVLLSVGTSGVVYPAAQVPEIALHSGATVVHVNPEPQGLGGQHEWLLAGAAGEVLPSLLQAAFDE